MNNYTIDCEQLGLINGKYLDPCGNIHYMVPLNGQQFCSRIDKH